MATKRPAAPVHPSRREQVPDEPRRKRQKPDNAGPKSFKKAHPVNEVKSQIRSLKRQLGGDRLPADVRVEKERALQTAQRELEAAQTAQQRSAIISKFHKIRFFDRQKATKKLKKAQKELKDCEDNSNRRADVQKRIDDAQVNVNYAIYYPLERDYVSLFPRKEAKTKDVGDEAPKDEDRERSTEHGGDAEMWQLVKKCMANGKLDDLRTGKLDESQDMKHGDGEVLKDPERLRSRLAPQQDDATRGRNQHDHIASDAESEGFFE